MQTPPPPSPTSEPRPVAYASSGSTSVRPLAFGFTIGGAIATFFAWFALGLAQWGGGPNAGLEEKAWLVFFAGFTVASFLVTLTNKWKVGAVMMIPTLVWASVFFVQAEIHNRENAAVHALAIQHEEPGGLESGPPH